MRALLFCLLALGACAPRPPQAHQTWITMPEVGKDRYLPRRNSAYGDNLSPLVKWGGEPRAKSFILILDDVDAPGRQPFLHWLIWNIRGDYTGLAEGVPASIHPASAPEATQGRNDAGGIGYFGPKPPSGVHHYHLRLIALDTVLTLPDGADADAVLTAARGHEVARAERVLLFAAPAGP